MDEENLQVSFSLADWQNVLMTMEKGISTIGFTAFEIGGRVMREMQDQLNTQITAQKKENNESTE